MIDWEALRRVHLAEYNGTYLNSAANGIISQANEDFILNDSSRFREAPGKYRKDFKMKAIPAIKEQVAELVNAKSSEIALIPNFSIGLNLFVQSLHAKTKVLLIEDDYPSLTTPFIINDFEIVWTTFEEDKTIDLTKVEEVLKKYTPQYFALSHCQYLTGYLADLQSIGSLCKEYNCKLIVDATQSFGAIGIDVQECNISILGASCYKWALAGFGNGFMYINEKVLAANTPKSGGFNSFPSQDGKSEYEASMKSYEPGHHDHVAFHRLGFALQTIKELNQDFIYLQIIELMDYLIDQLEEADIQIIGDFQDENRLGIIVLKGQSGLSQHIASKGIEVSDRGGNIRIGVHYYNNEEDVDVLVESVKNFILSA
jgi:selenocysteine lyase/cysteine desulfurase